MGERLSGLAGEAVEVLSEMEPPDPIEWSSGVGLWFLYCPGQSPAWDCYQLSCVHLRPIVGESQPPRIAIPHATHEILLYAYDPDKNPTPEDPKTWRMLTPVNVCEQIQVPSDADAKDLLKLAAQNVVDGRLPAEPLLAGQKEPWHTVLLKTAAHYRGEEHAS